MTGLDLVVRARRAVVDGAVRPAAVGVRAGRITAVAGPDDPLQARAVVVLQDDEVLLPGLVDTHVHVNEPGRTEWEGFATATTAAAAGGITTLVDMPLNSVPPTTTLDALRVKQRAAAGRIAVDVGFWGGAVPGNTPDLAELHAAGVFGFKCFLVDSGVPEFGFLDAARFAAAMDATGRLGALMIVHAEDGAHIESGRAAGEGYAGFLASRPPRSERAAVDRVLREAARTGGRAHLLHLSGADSLAGVRAARAAGVDVSVETCPHYLALTAAEVPDGGTEFKCCPPIRDAANQDALWRGLAAGDVDMVVSDHSPSTAALKQAPGGPGHGDFALAWGGIASLQVSLPVVWTAARDRGRDLAEVVRWMALAPADRVGLAHKGRIATGADADLVVFAPEEEFTVDPHRLAHRNPVSAYSGRRLRGVVRQTWLRGMLVHGDQPPRGRFLRRGRR